MSGVGEMIASAVGNQIASKLGEFAKEEVTLQWRFKEDVEDIAEKMKDLKAVIHDADDMLRRGEKDGEVVRRWLAKFKSVAYDVEDVLDELEATELIKKSQPKLKLFFSGNNPLLQQMTIAHNMKNVREKIDKIEKDVQALNLVPHEARAEGSRKIETFAAMKTGMVGRDIENDKIISLLLRSEANEDISIIPIIGLGGLGKTTLAQSVFADKRVNIFDLRAWVHVSKEFNLHKIGSAIMKSINSSINLDNCSLQFLQENLKKELANRRYLIALDDLWEEDGDNLERLKQIFQHGCKGSKIIVTTRHRNVVQKLHTGFLANQRKICPVPEYDHINLGVLSHDDCWMVMKQRAFGPDNYQGDLEEIGREIAKKCGGLPLVANALGQVMSELRTVQAWEEIRDTKINLGSRDQKDTLERLMLSYYYMNLDFKMCFTYLVVFPKGFVMDSDRLIQQWDALGYIRAGDDGQRCINYLLGMSFLQVSRSSSVSPSPVHARAPWKLTMHDLVHDLASVITANEFHVLDATEPRTWNKAKHRYCRHAQLIKYQNESKVLDDLPGKVRSLHFRDSGKLQLPQKAFSRSKYIRILDLSGCSIEGESTPSNIVLPSSINRLKLLRYLDATGLPITSLPRSFHTIQNMQTLIMSNCSLEILPESISSLQKLCYLDISCNRSLHKLPTSLGKLSKLSFLYLSGCSILQELPESIYELTCLRHLDMSECCALRKLPDKFGSLRKLVFLNMLGCSQLTTLLNNVNFESLEHMDLSSCHKLENLPHDFGNLQKLGFLNLSDCYKVSKLPESFCQLKHLKDLDLSDCHDLRELPECFGDLSELESLNLTSCSKLRLLPESFRKLFKLRHLNLSYCTRLEKLPSMFGDLKLQMLDISSASSLHDLPASLGDMTSLTQLEVTSAAAKVFNIAQVIKKSLNFPEWTEHAVHEIDNGGCSSIVELAQLTCREMLVARLENVRHPEDAERAKLRDKSDLRLLGLHWGAEGEEGKSVLERLIPPRTLEQFFLYGYMSKDFPSWMSHISSYLPSLTYLMLSGLGTCDTLPPFGRLPNLRSFSMENIPNIRKIGKEFYGEGRTCTKLRVIHLASMENLVEWWTTQSGEENEEFLIPNLHQLELKDCPNLKFLPYPPRSMFWLLDNSDAVLPEGGFGKLSSSTLPFQMVIFNCNSSPDKWDRLQHFPTLETFEVKSCSGLRALPEALRCFTSLTNLNLISLKELEALPEWIGQLISLKLFNILNCPNLTSLPESMKKLTALRELWLQECKGLEILPTGIGQLTSLQNLVITDCPNLTSFPESMKKLTALRDLVLRECKGLETLPEWIGQLTSLRKLSILDCPNLTSLPESIQNLTVLKKLDLRSLKALETLPEGIRQLTSLRLLIIDNCPNLTFLPESMKNLTALRELWLTECRGLKILPEGIGQLTSLREFNIVRCPNLTSLPESIRNLTALKELYIWGCPSLVERCQGEDADMISHIQKVILDGEKLESRGRGRRGPLLKKQ